MWAGASAPVPAYRIDLEDRIRGMEKDWQPIETAPRDGNVFLAYGCHDETGERWEVVYFDEPEDDGSGVWTVGRTHFHPKSEWCFGTQEGKSLHRDLFTHWRPLDPPTLPQEKTNG